MGKPKLHIPFTRFDIVIEVLAALVLLFITILLLVKYGQLPNTIATHFNLEGEADAWGSKSTVIVIWLVSVILYIMLTILNKHPRLFNFPVEITEENADIQYKLALRLLRILKFTLLIIFMLILLSSLRAPDHNKDLLLGPYFAFIAMALTFGPIIYYFILARKNS